MARNRKRGGFFFSGPARGSSLTSGGGFFFLAFLAVVIGAGFLLAGGNPFPQKQLTQPPEGTYEIDEESLKNDPNARGNLQLKTIKFKECAQTSAVTLQIDITGSMINAMPNMRNAVYTFTDQLSDDSVIGIQAYSTRNARLEVIPVSLYKDVKDRIRPAIDALTADGSTNTYAALQFSKEVLQNAIAQYPNRTFSFIFFSDGNPNVPPSRPEDIASAAQEIKDLGVTVYSIGLGGVNASIIRSVASSPDKAFTTANSQDLAKIYSEIAQKLCSSNK